METERLKRYSAAEVALLAIFALGLVLSLALVRIRGKVELAPPVELGLAGLSASLPTGTTWETAGGWRYESDNAYVLLALMRVRGRPMMHVRWRYALCDEPIADEQMLQKRADSAGGRLLFSDVTEGQVPMHFGRIFTPTEGGQEFLVGVASLDFGRRLELHVAYRNDAWFAENVFRTLAAGVIYSRPEQTEAGAESVQRFMADRLGRIAAANTSQEMRFLVKDTRDRPLGFVESRHFSFDDDQGEGHHRLTGRQLEADGAYSESDLWLSVDDQTFSWTMQTWTPRSRRPRVVELRADVEPRLTVVANTQRTRVFYRTPMLLPEPLLPALAAELTRSGDVIVVDVLTGNGSVVPTRLAAIEPEQSYVRSSSEIVLVRADYLHRDGASDDLIFDPAGHYLGRFEQEPNRLARLWEAAQEAELVALFGERFEQSSRRNFE